MTNFPSPRSPRVTAYITPPPSGLSWGTFLARLVVGGVLSYAGLSKALAPLSDFAAAIDTYHLLPSGWATPLAAGLPWIEMWTGLALILGYWIRPFALVSIGLFGVFLMALASALLRHLDLTSCGCFGSDTLSPHVTIWMDSVLLLLSILIPTVPRSQAIFSLDAWIAKSDTKRR